MKKSICRSAISASCRRAKPPVSMRLWTGSPGLSRNMSIPAPFCRVPARPRHWLAAGSPALPPPAQRIAIARDEAFSFLYPHILAGWRNAGAEIAFFSPLADEPPPDHCDLCWLPGGYPELHAGRLAAAAAISCRFAPVRGNAGPRMANAAAIWFWGKA